MALPEERLRGGSGAVVYRFPKRRGLVVRRRRAAALVWLVALLGVGLLATEPPEPSPGIPTEAARAPSSVVVDQAGSLWKVAERWAPEGTDPRLYVARIIARNDLEGAGVQAGTRLELPR